MPLDLFPIKRALISVSDKKNLESIAQSLHKNQVEILSSGGTGAFLKMHNIPFIPIEEVTKNPEAFQGRMKTLSFQIGSALLFRRDVLADQQQAEELGIKPIDLVICNLYPFADVVQRKGTLEELIEQIDIGGPTLIRASAKNFAFVAVCTHPSQYTSIIEMFEKNKGALDLQTRKTLAQEAFRLTSTYDALIANQLEIQAQNTLYTIPISSHNAKELRYGENPHQKGWVYLHPTEKGLAQVEPLQGKPLSYNNLLDADAALRCTSDLARFTVAPFSYAVSIIKHLNPCGAAVSSHLKNALKLAWNGDPVSSFGSILCFSAELDENCALWLQDKFVEVILAPSFSKPAQILLAKKKNLRLLTVPLLQENPEERLVRSISGGWVVQTADIGLDQQFLSKTETPFPEEKQSLAHFGILVAKFLKSNAIVLVQESSEGYFVIGAGMGNPNRLISLKQAIEKARENGCPDLSELVLISDAFFPFPDNIELAYKAGIRCIIQPGGSVKDDEIIEACNKRKMAMAFTGRRHFIH